MSFNGPENGHAASPKAMAPNGTTTKPGFTAYHQVQRVWPVRFGEQFLALCQKNWLAAYWRNPRATLLRLLAPL